MAGEKRTQDQEESLIKENVIIVDIEGTTTSISFVKETLFPYVRENLKKYIDAKWEDQEFKHDLEKLKEQAKKDEDDKIEGVVPISGSTPDEEKESLVKNVLWQMDGDRKTGALKQLQGHMWREAYDSGSVKGHVYEDVPECLKSWKNAGKKIYVYSSGSVEAQKMLFGHSEHGDLLEYFSGYFDTEVGMKQEAASYKNILNKIKAEATDVIFLTDIVKEAKAAKEAGLSSIIMIREGNAPLTEEDKAEFRTAKSFLDLPFPNAAKRQKLDTSEVAKDKPAAEPLDEKMEVSEDVEMTDVSDKDSKSKIESNDTKVEPEANETKENKDANVEKPANENTVEKDEAMEIDGKVEAVKKIDENVKNTKPVEETKEAKVDVAESEKESKKVAKDDAKSEEIDKTVEKETKASNKPEETIEKSNADETDKAIPADSNKTEITEKPVELSDRKIDSAKAEISTNIDEVMEESAPKTDAKSTTKITDDKTETKTEEESEKKSDLSKAKLETETEKIEAESTPVPAESGAKPMEAEKSEAKAEIVAAEESEKIVKPTDTSKKSEDAVPKSDEINDNETVKENGTAKNKETSKTETEVEAAVNKDESDIKKTEPKVEETVVAESTEAADKKSTDETKAEAGAVAETKKEVETKEAEVTKSVEEKESDKEGAKNDAKEDSKDETAKKVNGTTQNGETVTADENKKIHTNGVNEACTSDAADTKTNTEKREPESSTDGSAESIKVKKVVDSTVADGAGEPDVVPPAVVAATS